MAIDTLKVARRLREAGFNEAQAEAVAAAVQESSEGSDRATKGDLTVQSVELRAEIAAVRSEMREMEQRLIARIESVRSEIVSMRGEIASDLLGRMFQMIIGAVLVNIVAMAGLMFAFAKLLDH
jgi:DNA-binding transcriptional MerR regulator